MPFPRLILQGPQARIPQNCCGDCCGNGEGLLGLPGQVRELGFLLSFPSFPRDNRSSKNVWESAWKSQTSFFQTSAACWGNCCGDCLGDCPFSEKQRNGTLPGSLRSSFPCTLNSQHPEFPGSFRSSLRTSFGESGLGGPVDGRGNGNPIRGILLKRDTSDGAVGTEKDSIQFLHTSQKAPRLQYFKTPGKH